MNTVMLTSERKHLFRRLLQILKERRRKRRRKKKRRKRKRKRRRRGKRKKKRKRRKMRVEFIYTAFLRQTHEHIHIVMYTVMHVCVPSSGDRKGFDLL